MKTKHIFYVCAASLSVEKLKNKETESIVYYGYIIQSNNFLLSSHSFLFVLNCFVYSLWIDLKQRVPFDIII